MKRARRGSIPRAAEPPGWASAAPDDSDFKAFGHGDLIGALADSRPPVKTPSRSTVELAVEFLAPDPQAPPKHA